MVRARLAVAVLLTIFAAGCSRSPAVLHMSTTTSVENSGLLNDIIPVFEQSSGIDVQVVAVGSGRAVAILEAGDADVALTHDPDAEQTVVAKGVTARYQKLMYNDFLMAGPPADPAHVAQSTDALDVMRRIAAAQVPFASRADSSGTHARERKLWKEAGVTPQTKFLLETGSGMAATLRVASEREAYVLTDRATLLQLASTVRLKVLHENDPLYLNTYAVMTRAGLHGDRLLNANRLMDWLTSDDGRARIAAFRVKDRPAFMIWPATAASDRPDALPNGR